MSLSQSIHSCFFRNGKPKRGSRGFSLLEVIVASFFLATAIGGLAFAWHTQLRAAFRSQNFNLARFLARSEMEKAISQGFKQLDTHLTFYPLTSQIERESKGRVHTTEFTITISSEELVENKLRSVLVEVSYQEGEAQRQYSLESSLFVSE